MSVFKYAHRFMCSWVLKDTEFALSDIQQNLIIGIKHDFPFINIRKVPREVLKTEGEARGFQHLPRDLANVNE